MQLKDLCTIIIGFWSLNDLYYFILQSIQTKVSRFSVQSLCFFKVIRTKHSLGDTKEQINMQEIEYRK